MQTKPWMDPSLSIEERMAAASAAMNKVEDMHSQGSKNHSDQRAAAMTAAKRELQNPALTAAAIASSKAKMDSAQKMSSSLEDEMKKNFKAKKDAKKLRTDLEESRRKAIESGPIKPKFRMFEQGCFNDDESFPEELVVSIEVPLMKSAKEMELELNEKKILFSDSAGMYKLSVLLAHPVFDDQAKAKFDKGRKKLTITLPCKPPVKTEEGSTTAVSTAAAPLVVPSPTPAPISSISTPFPQFRSQQRPETITICFDVEGIEQDSASVSFHSDALEISCFAHGKQYATRMALFATVVPEKCRFDVSDINMVLVLHKESRENWAQVLVEEDKHDMAAKEEQTGHERVPVPDISQFPVVKISSLASYRQSAEVVAVIVEVEGVNESSVQAEFKEKRLKVEFHTDGNEGVAPKYYEIEFVTGGVIIPSKCYINVASLNVLVVLEKADHGANWGALNDAGDGLDIVREVQRHKQQLESDEVRWGRVDESLHLYNKQREAAKQQQTNRIAANQIAQKKFKQQQESAAENAQAELSSRQANENLQQKQVAHISMKADNNAWRWTAALDFQLKLQVKTSAFDFSAVSEALRQLSGQKASLTEKMCRARFAELQRKSTNSTSAEAVESAVVWTPALDAWLSAAVEDAIFDFGAVASQLQLKLQSAGEHAQAQAIDATICRLRFSEIDKDVT